MKKVCLVLLAALCLTGCNQTIKLPPSHYDQLADQPYIESYPLKADISLLKRSCSLSGPYKPIYGRCPHSICTL